MISGYFSRTMLLLCVVASVSCQMKPAQRSAAIEQLVWSDEFNYTGLPDSTKWDYDAGDGCPDVCGWGNHELQFYTVKRRENARVENGHLIIEARREKWQKQSYTSARLVSRKKGDWLYGRIEVRAQIPGGTGVWPAVWMLPTDWKYGNWPRSGEIDIMEHVGFMPDSVFGTVHTDAYNGMLGTQKSKGLYLPDAEHSFHVYGAEWTPDYIEFTVDGKPFNRFTKSRKKIAEWPFDQRFHLLLNIAVGGDWGGKKGVDEKIWPCRMSVDYVRVYQK